MKCKNCGFTKRSHERKDFFKKVKINMIFADKPNLQPCKKFEAEDISKKDTSCKNCGMDLQVALIYAEGFLRSKSFPETNKYWKNFKDCIENGKCPYKKFEANHTRQKNSFKESVTFASAEDFDLSEKISFIGKDDGFIRFNNGIEDVKTFIKKDLEIIKDYQCGRISFNQLLIRRNKLCGEKFRK